MRFSGTCILQFTYPIGSNNDPPEKKGLAHFLEHCMMKAKINEINLIDVCQKYGATVNAYTSLEEIRIEINILNDNVHNFIKEYSEHLGNCGDFIVDDQFIENEKLIIIKEMETKVQNILGNEILGYESTISKITKCDIKNYLKLLQLLRPKIRIYEIKLENKFLINEVLQEYVKNKFIELNSHTINSLSLIIYQMYCSFIHRPPDILSIGYRKYMKFDSAFLSFIRGISSSEIDNYIKDNYEWFKNSKHDLNKLIIELREKIEESTNIVIEEGRNQEIEIIKYSKINNIKYCIIRSQIEDCFASISICTNDLFRDNIINISKALGGFLKSIKSDVSIKVNYEIGLIRLYLAGNEDSILFLIKNLINIDSKLVNYLSIPSKDAPLHILEQIHLDILHKDTKQLKSSKLKKTLDISGIGNLSIVTNIVKVNIFEQILSINKNHTIPSRKNREDLIWNLKKYSSEYEYVQIWKGPTYFSDDKYISHILWAILDGTTGELYKKMSLENPYFYSFKFFPRELYDSGYLILYVYTKNKKKREIVGSLFLDLLTKICLKLTETDLNTIKKKLVLSKKNSNKGFKMYLNLSTFILFEDSLESFFNYEEKINALSLIEVKNFINCLIVNNSKVLT